MNEPELSRKVSEEEFNAFVAAYPSPLAEDTSGIPVPPVTSYCDFGSGLKWPEAVVASVCRGDLMEPAEPRIFRIWDTPEAVARRDAKLKQIDEVLLARKKLMLGRRVGVTTRNLELSIAVIDPTRNVVGTGPDDDVGIPECTLEDLKRAEISSDAGYRYVYAKVSVFPDNLQTSWRSGMTHDIQSTTADALRHLAEKLAELPWKE